MNDLATFPVLVVDDEPDNLDAFRFNFKRVFKILAVIAGVFFGSLIYLQSQNLISVNWDRLQEMSQWTVTTLAHSLTDVGQISTISGNLGIPLTGGLAAGFAFGVMKG